MLDAVAGLLSQAGVGRGARLCCALSGGVDSVVLLHLLHGVQPRLGFELVAAHVHREVHAGAPIVSAELPETGERFEGIMPPVAMAPCFSVRKPANAF